MNRLKVFKWAFVGAWIIGLVLVFGTGPLFRSNAADDKKHAPQTPAAAQPAANPADYVGEASCKDCHDKQFNNYSHTAHAKLADQSSWKGKVVGCESCHGPGKAHVDVINKAIDDGVDPTTIKQADLKIGILKNMTSKQVSETCLQCHAGREEHNNFRRGEHWRNDIGCTDCHSPHGDSEKSNVASSNAYVSPANAEKPGFATEKMLKTSEPQLCLQCHTEAKHQFQQPFHHKVLEGTMKCTDCHNAHGGFETKQTRLTTGADAGCIKCHSDKQGPFAFEHAPIKTEGCSACHIPHGSSNPRMLKTSSVAQLCLTCHSQDHGIGAVEAPSFHNLAVQYKDCTACHVKIHGSHTSPVFFR